MKFKFLGEGEITVRHMTFEAGKAMEVDDDGLAAKLAALDYFEEVRPGRKPKLKVKANGDSK